MFGSTEIFQTRASVISYQSSLLFSFEHSPQDRLATAHCGCFLQYTEVLGLDKSSIQVHLHMGTWQRLYIRCQESWESLVICKMKLWKTGFWKLTLSQKKSNDVLIENIFLKQSDMWKSCISKYLLISVWNKTW